MVNMNDYSYYTNSLRKKVWNLMKSFEVFDEDIPDAVRSFQGILNDIDTVESIVLADIEAGSAEKEGTEKKSSRK